jgi:putative transposon-encoded protein
MDSKIWNSGFDKVVKDGAAGNQAQKGIFFEDDRGIIQRLTEAEGNEESLNPETVERNPIGQEAPSTEIRSYNSTFDKDIIVKKGAPNYEFFAMMKRLRPTGNNAKIRVYLVDFRIEEIGTSHNKYYAEAMNMTVTVNSVNETDGILSVNFAQDGDYSIGVMGRTDTSTSDDESTYTYGFTSSKQISIGDIETSKEEVAVKVGNSARVAVSFSPLGCPYDFTVKSGDDSIASVGRWNQSVDIKGKKIGTTTVTVTSTEDLAAEAEIEVTVS